MPASQKTIELFQDRTNLSSWCVMLKEILRALSPLPKNDQGPPKEDEKRWYTVQITIPEGVVQQVYSHERRPSIGSPYLSGSSQDFEVYASSTEDAVAQAGEIWQRCRGHFGAK